MREIAQLQTNPSSPISMWPWGNEGLSHEIGSFNVIYPKTGDLFKWTSNHSSQDNWKLIREPIKCKSTEAATFWVRCLCPAYGNKAGYKGKFMAWHRDLQYLDLSQDLNGILALELVKELYSTPFEHVCTLYYVLVWILANFSKTNWI